MRILSLCRCVVLVLFASGSASGSAAAPAPMPVPERQNAAMAALYARAHAAAKVASDGATPELLRFMDDATFRANLTACCPAVAALPAAALLARYRAELEVVEMMHNFGAEPGGRHDDLDVAIGERSSYFQNLWELQYLGLVNTSGHSNEDCGNFMNWAEMELYGFPGMRGNGSCPASFAEAANRPIYVAFNQLKIDVGNPNFGDVSAVFRRGYVRNMTLIAAVDTGLWEMTCNRSGSGGHGFHHDPRNCTAWDPTGFDPATTQRLPVGTLDHYDHLVLANPRWFNGTFSLSDTFARLLGGRAAAAATGAPPTRAPPTSRRTGRATSRAACTTTWAAARATASASSSRASRRCSARPGGGACRPGPRAAAGSWCGRSAMTSRRRAAAAAATAPATPARSA